MVAKHNPTAQRQRMPGRWNLQPLLYASWLGIFVPRILGDLSLPHTHLAREFLVRSWNKDSGLTDNKVHSLLQTRDGYLWIGTAYGLLRFDGVAWVRFTRGNRPDMRNDHCAALAEDTAGHVWIGTPEGLTRWDGRQFRHWTRTEGLAGEAVRAIAPSQEGGVWVSTSQGVQRFRGGAAAPEPALAGSESTGTFVEGPGGHLWLGGRSLQQLDLPSHRRQSFPFPDLHGAWVVASLLPGPNAEVMVLVRREEANDRVRLGTLRQNRWEDVQLGPIPNSDRADWIVRDGRGHVWMPAGGQGLARFRDGRGELMGAPWSAQEDFALCGLADFEGNLWIGTEASGLFCLTPKQLTSTTPADGLGHENVRSVWPASGGGVWAATDAGLSRVGSDARSITNWTTLKGHSLGKVKTVAETSRRELWIGLGLEHLTLRQDQLEVHRYYRPPGDLSDDDQNAGFNKVRCFLPARDGSIWVAVPRGLHHLTRDGDRWYTTQDGLGADDVRALLETRDGVLWAGTAGGGLSRLSQDPTTPFVTLTRRDGLSRDTVWALLEDSDGVVWAGTDGGLNRIENGSVVSLDTRQGLPAEGVNSLVEDNFGHLWVGHDRGIYRVSRAELTAVAAGRAKQVHCIPFGVADGMTVAECNGQTATPAACKTDDGRLWFATPKGLVVVDPKTIRENETPPRVVIEHVLADDAILFGDAAATPPPTRNRADGALRIEPGRARFLEFRFTANSFIASEAIRFRYRLEGYEEAWHDAGTRRFAHYIGLPPGSYRFHVLAANHHDVWNDSGAQVAFSLAPSLTQTAWFRTTGVLLFLGGIATFGRWRLQVAQREAGVRERAYLTRSLHDHLGADLTSLHSLAELVRREIGPEHPARQHVNRLTEVTTNAGRNLRDAIFTLGPGEATLVGLCARLAQFAGDLLTPLGVRCHFKWPMPMPELDLHPNAAFELYLAIKEALANVAKHADARNCVLSLEISATELSWVIADDGRGFAAAAASAAVSDSPNPNHGNGLRNLQMHATELGGRCQVDATPGQGVTTRLVVPLHALRRAHSALFP